MDNNIHYSTISECECQCIPQYHVRVCVYVHESNELVATHLFNRDILLDIAFGQQLAPINSVVSFFRSTDSLAEPFRTECLSICVVPSIQPIPNSRKLSRNHKVRMKYITFTNFESGSGECVYKYTPSLRMIEYSERTGQKGGFIF